MVTFFKPSQRSVSRARLALLLLIVVVNIGVTLYTSYVHQKGVVDIMHYLRHEHESALSRPHANDIDLPRGVDTTVGFFMPCHSTPWRSHLVYPEIDAWALTCEPPLHLTTEERESYLDEADVFYADSKAWIDENMKDVATVATKYPVHHSRVFQEDGSRSWPRYLVFFQQLEYTMKEVLSDSKYEECWRGFNSHWHDDSRRKGEVIVWCIR